MLRCDDVEKVSSSNVCYCRGELGGDRRDDDGTMTIMVRRIVINEKGSFVWVKTVLTKRIRRLGENNDDDDR